MTLIEVISASKGLPLEFHIFGATDELDEFFENAGISSSESPIATYTYGYKRSTLISALQELHVSLFLSTWPETYHISLGEAMYMGVVPIATNLGAHNDRIQHEKNGLLVDPHDSQAVVKSLLRLHSDRKFLGSLRKNAKSVKLMDIEEHGQRLEKIYSDLKTIPTLCPNKRELLLNSQINLSALGVRLGQDLWSENSVDWDDPA